MGCELSHETVKNIAVLQHPRSVVKKSSGKNKNATFINGFEVACASVLLDDVKTALEEAIWRNQSRQPIVRVRYVRLVEPVDGKQRAEVYMDKRMIHLDQICSLDVLEFLLIFRDSMRGLSALLSRYGKVALNYRTIGIDQQGYVRVWLSEDSLATAPKSRPLNNQRILITQLLRILEDCCAPSCKGFFVSIRSWAVTQTHLKIVNALGFLEAYCTVHTIRVPMIVARYKSRLENEKSVEKTGMTFARIMSTERKSKTHEFSSSGRSKLPRSLKSERKSDLMETATKIYKDSINSQTVPIQFTNTTTKIKLLDGSQHKERTTKYLQNNESRFFDSYCASYQTGSTKTSVAKTKHTNTMSDKEKKSFLGVEQFGEYYPFHSENFGSISHCKTASDVSAMKHLHSVIIPTENNTHTPNKLKNIREQQNQIEQMQEHQQTKLLTNRIIGQNQWQWKVSALIDKVDDSNPLKISIIEGADERVDKHNRDLVKLEQYAQNITVSIIKMDSSQYF